MGKRSCILMAFFWFVMSGLFLPAQRVLYKKGSDRKIQVPVEVFDGIVYLNVLLNDEHEASFILDTGTDSVSVVSVDLAQKMGVLEPRSEAVAGSMRRRSKVSRLYGTRLGIGDAQFVGYDFIALPLARLRPYWGRKIEGILGGNILQEFVLAIDYQRESLSLTAAIPEEMKREGHRLPMFIMGTTPVVEARLVGKSGSPLTGRFILDTGVRQSLVNTPFTERHDLLNLAPRTIENITGYGMGGMIVERLGRIPHLDLGGIRLREPVLQLSSKKEGLRTSELFDGIIGGDLLQRFFVVFDFPERTLYLKPNQEFDHPFLYDMSGIYFTMEPVASGTKTRVVSVVSGSPAAASGVRKDDVILEVDGRPVSSFSMPGLKAYFKREGKKVELKLDRNGERVGLILELKPYL